MSYMTLFNKFIHEIENSDLWFENLEIILINSKIITSFSLFCCVLIQETEIISSFGLIGSSFRCDDRSFLSLLMLDL